MDTSNMQVYKINNPVIAKFIRRDSRVSATVEIEGNQVKAHLTNTGKLLDILQPCISLLCMPIKAPKTKVRIIGSQAGNLFSVIDTLTQERIAKILFESGNLPGWEDWTLVKTNPAIGNTIYDFLVKDSTGKERIVELKSAVYYFPEDGSARYPDTITTRAHRQFKIMLENPDKFAILFVTAHPLAKVFKPSHDDPEVVALLKELKDKRVPMNAIKLFMDKAGRIFVETKPIPVIV
ncbi:MAG: hypothetical protein GXO48_08590 [Chlorobi bacterium]|nr:hypothetical protein [Chlorobiota bacterium]